MEIISRSDAKLNGLKRYYTGKPCKRGHYSERFVNDHSCIECKREKQKEADAKYYSENKDECLKRNKEYYAQNRERLLDSMRNWRESNRDYLKSYDENRRNEKREYDKERSKMFPHIFSAKTAKRRAALLERTLPGFDTEILSIYEEASLKKQLGEDVHVDHVIPLQGRSVSGLHVPWNLEIIDASDNCSKGNSFEPYIEVY